MYDHEFLLCSFLVMVFILINLSLCDVQFSPSCIYVFLRDPMRNVMFGFVLSY